MLLIPQDLANAIANYLSQQPYKETYQLMAALSQLKEEEPIKDAGDDQTLDN